ncbi:hypothetical protein [Mycoplasma suis]|uniref:Uncharacterized protein n=1 Tax=Mycoplasma suis (strain Illinois) TaxID=768700 RepID=F0QRQ7_MYCSL|nr:hypothetical protein [Mycoplasma suis]ADX98177.1 hypothetical protein MSU_0646 [Mycoplasma suis str. Illinois]
MEVSLQQELAKFWKTENELQMSEVRQKLLLERLEETASILKDFSVDLNMVSIELQLQINKTISELNISKEELRKVHEEWIELKEKIIYFQNYAGKIKKIICKNIQFSEKDKCLVSNEKE